MAEVNFAQNNVLIDLEKLLSNVCVAEKSFILSDQKKIENFVVENVE
jgi:hypothetical protein